MNFIYKILISYTLLFGFKSTISAQSISQDSLTTKVIKDFYCAHNSAWIKIKDNFKLIKTLDSINNKYCSVKLNAKLNKEFRAAGLDHDLLTNDEGADTSSLNNITVTKDNSQQNLYIVSWKYQTMTPSYKQIYKEVTLHVKLIKEFGALKIDSLN